MNIAIGDTVVIVRNRRLIKGRVTEIRPPHILGDFNGEFHSFNGEFHSFLPDDIMHCQCVGKCGVCRLLGEDHWSRTMPEDSGYYWYRAQGGEAQVIYWDPEMGWLEVMGTDINIYVITGEIWTERIELEAP